MKIVLKTLVIIIIGLFIVGCSNEETTTGTMGTITTEEVKEILDNKNENYVLIDVREDSEFNEGHIPGAVNIPLGNIDSITYSTSRTIIVYCRSGNRSNQAAIKLKNMGYNVKDISREGLLYHRDDQIVARDIIILRKK